MFLVWMIDITVFNFSSMFTMLNCQILLGRIQFYFCLGKRSLCIASRHHAYSLECYSRGSRHYLCQGLITRKQCACHKNICVSTLIHGIFTFQKSWRHPVLNKTLVWVAQEIGHQIYQVRLQQMHLAEKEFISVGSHLLLATLMHPGIQRSPDSVISAEVRDLFLALLTG